MSPTPTAEVIVGRYVLYRRIASGGMATVYLGRLRGPVGFSRMVAIKRLLPRFARDPDFVTMFLDEARIAAGLRHPNIVPTLDVVATKGEVFLVMEYVQGESLAQLLRAAARLHEPMPQRIAASIVSGVLLGLHAAHEARDARGVPLNMVHRDVSPHNVLVGADGMARLLDFGVAKANGRAQHLTRQGHIKGKLGYMAPEQLAGDPVTRESDVYSAAVVLWEALTGRKLFEGSNQAIAIKRASPSHIEPPSKFRPDVTPEMDAVVLKGLAWERHERFSTAREMAAEIERIEGAVSILEVAEWVEIVAGQQIHIRAQQLQSLEPSTASKLPAPPDLQTASTEPAPRREPNGETTVPEGKRVPDTLHSASTLGSDDRTSVSTPVVRATQGRATRRRLLARLGGVLTIAMALGAATVITLRVLSRTPLRPAPIVFTAPAPAPAIASPASLAPPLVPPAASLAPVEPLSQASPIEVADPVPVTSLPSAPERPPAGASVVRASASAQATRPSPAGHKLGPSRAHPPALPKAPVKTLTPFEAIGGRQ
jgi:eukaryotic-like serine/threonine-protein kinase